MGLNCARTLYVVGMSENITIYTTPHCPGCALTQRKLDKAGINYNAIDLSKRPDLVEQFKNEGLLSAPIIETQKGRSSGFNPERIREIIALADPYTKPNQTRQANSAGSASVSSNPSHTRSPNQSVSREQGQGRGL